MRYLERNRRSLGRNTSFGAAMTALALVHSAPALAQEEVAAVDTVAAVDADQIIVTGSRVARDGFEAPTPLTVLSETEIENSSPSNNIADFVNTLFDQRLNEHPGYYGEMIWISMMLEQWLQSHPQARLDT